MHDPFELLEHVSANLSIVLTFAYSQSALGALRFDLMGPEQKRNAQKIAFGRSERRADRALMEMAVQLRILDDSNNLARSFKENELPPLGQVVQDDGAITDLYFRDLTNKILHAEGFRWEFADPKCLKVVCLGNDRWKEAHIILEVLLTYIAGIGRKTQLFSVSSVTE